jgi:hypothetical protein
LRTKLSDSKIAWQLSELEFNELLLNWLRKSIKKCDLIEKRFFEQLSQ